MGDSKTGYLSELGVFSRKVMRLRNSNIPQEK